jgi:hypothetical protein
MSCLSATVTARQAAGVIQPLHNTPFPFHVATVHLTGEISGSVELVGMTMWVDESRRSRWPR